MPGLGPLIVVDAMQIAPKKQAPASPRCKGGAEAEWRRSLGLYPSLRPGSFPERLGRTVEPLVLSPYPSGLASSTRCGQFPLDTRLGSRGAMHHLLSGAVSEIAGERFVLIGDLSVLVERIVPWPWS